MIDTKDIRLGNLVLDKHGKPSRVSEIGKTGIKVEGGPGTYRQYAGEFSPIPISDDWLHDLGFKKPNHWYNINNELYIQIIAERISYCVDESETARDIQFVHQLQNLYYTLTGNELNVNIELL